MEVYDVDPYPVGWYFVAFSDEIGPRSVTHVHYFGQEIVLYRGASGAVHALDAYCPHQGAHLGWGGKVKGDDIVCPFHGWQWGPDGSNTALPYAPCDRDALLAPWPARELDGLVFVWYHPDRAEPAWEPQPVPEFSHPEYPPMWRSEPIELTVNLQDTFENGVDAAHFVSVHRAFEMPKVEIVLNEGPHFIADLPDQKLRSDRGPFEASVSSDYWGLGIDIARMKSGFVSIVYMMLQTPIDQDRIRVRFYITVKRLSSRNPAAESPEWVARIGEGIVAEFMNDKVIWDHKIYRNRPRLAENEGPVREFRRWARQFYACQSTPAQSTPTPASA
jgi:nitrite reductase/ring-hydroxylating ferredoxin subunit